MPLANRLTRDTKIVIHGNSYIILYIMCCYLHFAFDADMMAPIMQIIIVLTVSYCDIYIFYQNIITINPDNKHIQTMNIFEVDLKVSLEELI